jgi:hypothetical protein
MTSAELWATELAKWSIPEEILAQAETSPWIHPPALFQIPNGVGLLVKTAADQARKLRPDFKLGVCGEHGGDGRSIQFFNEVGLDYVSCSPFRVPVARLEAGRAMVLKTTSFVDSL